MSSSRPIDWHMLQQAYGNAVDIPALLERICGFPAEPDWQTEPWFSLWSALYHQGDIYPASLAAVPAIVSALAAAPGRATMSFYLLPASIAVADSTNLVTVAPEVRRSFGHSLLELGSIASAALPSIKDPHTLRAARAAVLVSTGAFQQASDLLEADV
jgi:hypothetical protein